MSALEEMDSFTKDEMEKISRNVKEKRYVIKEIRWNKINQGTSAIETKHSSACSIALIALST